MAEAGDVNRELEFIADQAQQVLRRSINGATAATHGLAADMQSGSAGSGAPQSPGSTYVDIATTVENCLSTLEDKHLEWKSMGAPMDSSEPQGATPDVAIHPAGARAFDTLMQVHSLQNFAYKRSTHIPECALVTSACWSVPYSHIGPCFTHTRHTHLFHACCVCAGIAEGAPPFNLLRHPAYTQQETRRKLWLCGASSHHHQPGPLCPEGCCGRAAGCAHHLTFGIQPNDCRL